MDFMGNKTKPISLEENEKFNLMVERILVCPLCRLSLTRTNAVPGKGSRTAEIMFVGEGPGKQEDLKGFPFVGAAGKFLDELLSSINLSRDDVYITNVVKCRPPNNRDPKPDEIGACHPYLVEQIKIIKPKIICTLGNWASRTLVDPEISISKVHGDFVKKGEQYYCTLYHPAAALYNQSLKETLKEDFRKLGEFLKNDL